MTVPTGPHRENLALRLATLTTLLSAALALGAAGLIATPVCLLTMALTLIAGLAVPRWAPRLVNDSRLQTIVALIAIALLILATAGSGSQALLSGPLSGRLGAAVSELALPAGAPIGLLAALAAGALVAVALDIAERRGVQSALVLGIAVLGLASVAAPGTHLLPALIPGWPAVMFALARLAASATTAAGQHPGLATSRSRRSPELAPPRMNRTITTAQTARADARWQLLPVFAVITISLAVLTGAVFSGVATLGDRAASVDGGGGAGGRLGGGRSSSDYLGGEMDLTARGELGSNPVLEVTADSPRLWRAGTLDLYTGRGWQTTDPPGGLPTFVLESNGTAARGDAEVSSGSVEARTDQVRPVRVGVSGTQILAPGLLLSISSTALRTGGQILVGSGDRVTMTGGDGSGQYQVRTRGLPAVADPTAGPAVPSASTTATDDGLEVAEALDPRWTLLPSTVPERVLTLGRTLVSNATDRQAAVRAIEVELAERMTYTLDSPRPSPTADVVDDVLFVSRSGFCEQFATAEVVLLRAARVPARVAVGFSGGDPGDAGFRTLRRSDAHAWVEVWFPGVGWVTSDPTPAAEETRGWWQPVQEAIRRLPHAPVAWVGAALLLVLSSTASARLIRQRFRQVGVEDRPERSIDPDLAAAFTRLEAGLRGRRRARAPNETVAALARRLAQPPPVPGPGQGRDQAVDSALNEALQVLERALYAARPPSRAECLAAAGTINEWIAAGSNSPTPTPTPTPDR